MSVSLSNSNISVLTIIITVIFKLYRKAIKNLTGSNKIYAILGFNGFSTHSSRRWVINRLREKNVSIVDIAEALMMNINTVRLYLDDSSQARDNAISALDIAA